MEIKTKISTLYKIIRAKTSYSTFLITAYRDDTCVILLPVALTNTTKINEFILIIGYK